MEKIWNNRQIRMLLSADPDAVEQFLQSFGPVIYTWMYYQVGADTKIALDLTGQTLSRSIENLSAFDPTKETLFQWLKDRARQSRDEGLERWQIKPQRPRAWSKLPDEVLCGLSRCRSEPLDDNILSNSFVHEIVQTALAELEPRDRELLIHRFCHLNAEEHIAEEMNCRVEDIQDWLYRSRHSFRRVFFEIISSTNTGFAESSDTGELEIQDTNLEKLLSTTTIYQPLDNAQMDTLRTQLFQAAEITAKSLPEETAKSRHLAAGIIAFLMVLLIVGIYWMSQDESTETVRPTVSIKDTQKKPSEQKSVQTQKRQPTEDDIDGEELKLIFALGKAGDVDALLEILKSGQFTSQVAAAHFLGKLADPSAIDPLEQAEEHWYPEPVDDNPFAKAIGEILSRFPEAVEVVAVDEIEPEPTEQPKAQKDAQQPPAAVSNVTGIVSDFLNQPIANAVVELTEKQLFSKTKTGKKIASTETNASGQFEFSNTYEGLALLTSRTGSEDATLIRRSLWYMKDSICIANMGGKPALTGIVMIDGEPLANQRLYLSDTLDIANASFGQEVLTDTQGSFSFLGVPAGVYSLLNKGLDNRVHRLAILEMPQQDVFNVNLDILTVDTVVNYPAEPNQPMPTKAVLACSMDMPEDFHQEEAALTEDGSVLFENVLPGSYVLKVQLDSGVWIQQEVEIYDDITEQTLILDPVPEPTALLAGRLLEASPIDLFLTNTNQQIHIDLKPNAGGSYELNSIPPDVYSLAAFVKGQLIEFTQIDLQEETQMQLDIDPGEMMQSFSPLYVVVTDPVGLVVSGAQVWLTSGQQVDTISSTGHGAFLAIAPGDYTLSVALPGYPTINRQIDLKASTLLADPNPDNTVVIQLANQSPQ